jgi:hypothetical protein
VEAHPVVVAVALGEAGLEVVMAEDMVEEEATEVPEEEHLVVDSEVVVVDMLLIEAQIDNQYLHMVLLQDQGKEKRC